MNWKRLMLVIVPICMLVLMFNITATKAEEVPILYVGIEKKRMPYTYFDENQRPAGVIVSTINSVCQTAGVSCKFVGGPFNENLQALRNIKLNAVMVLDQSLPPEVDSLNLTHPPDTSSLKLTKQLCRLSPAFIQKKSAPARLKAEDFKDTVIGVQEGSVFHKFVTDTYGDFAKLKSYPLLESAIMDLVFDRVDAVFGDAGILNARVFDTQLDEYAGLVATDIDIPNFPTTTMALALRGRDITSALVQQDKDRFARLSLALEALNSDRSCLQLLSESDKQDKP